MSISFLPPPSAASIPDASETVSGKIRIATSAEATAGTNDLTAMTPAKTKSVVDAAVVGGVTYQGTFDASSPADLSNATKGDLYIISVAGTYQGQTWAVGDHLLINADMGGTLDPAKIDKVDNTDSVTSVAGRTGAVTLSTADISGLATVASTGAYSDLTGAPTLATVATTGAYSDLSGTPTLGTAAAEDVGTLAGNVVQLDGSARLPAVDGSQLTNLPSATVFYSANITSIGPTLPQITDSRRQHYNVQLAGGMTIPSATSAAIGGVYSVYNSDPSGAQTVNCPSTLLLSGATVTSYTVEPYEARSFVWVGASSLQEITATRLDHFNGVSITSPSNGEALVYNSTSGDWENSTVSASVAALNDVGDVNAPTPANTNVIKYNSTSGDWEAGAVVASEVSGLATVATTGAYSDLSGTPTNVSTFTNDAGYLTQANTVVLQYNSTTTATAVSSKDLHVYRLYGAGGFTLTVSATASNGLVEINNISGSACTISGPTFRRNGEGVTGGVTSITVEAGERRLFYLESISTWLEMNATLLDRLADVSITSPSNGEALIYNSTSGDWENGTVSASVAALNDIGDVNVTGAVNTNVLKYNSTSGDWEDGAVAYSEVTGTPTLATVASTGAYSDLSGTPTLGTAAAEDVGTLAGNVVQLDGSARLPAVDGSQLTNLPSGASTLGALTDVTLTSVADGQFLKYDSGSSAWVNSDSGLYAYYSFITTSTLAAPAQPQTLVVSLSSSLSQTLTLPTGSNDFVGTTISLANLNSGEWTIAAASGNYIRGLSSAPTLAQNQTLILALASFNTWLVVAYEEQGLGSLADVDVTGAVATNVLKYDGTDWVDGAVAYSEVTGTPTLGTAAALDVGTSANNVVQLDGSARLPAVDGSQLTNLPTGGSAPSVTSATPGATYTISTSTGIEEAYLLTPSTACAVTIPTASSAGSGYKYQVKNLSANTITISPSSGTIDGSASFALNVQYATVTLLSDGANWFVI